MSTSLRGVGGAPGIAVGAAVRFTASPTVWQPAETDPELELRRFAAAQVAAAAQLRMLAGQLRAEGYESEAGIFDAQSLLVEDPTLSEEVARRVRADPSALEAAILAAVAEMRAALERLDDPYLRERAADMDAVGLALIAALRGAPRAMHALPPQAIVVAEDLAPAEVIALRSSAAGFATAHGGPTSHTLILARAFGIPAVVGLGDAVYSVRNDARVILDGDSSLVILDAAEDELADYRRRIADRQAAAAQRRALRDLPGALADGHRVALLANIGRPEDAQAALEHGAEGIGLFRTEFLFFDRTSPPSEEEQLAAYRQVLAAMPGRPVVVRTVDVGGDKTLPYLGLGREPNPALGLRGVRLCMRRPELFQVQLRALLRAALHGDLRIMLPMVATPEDLAWGREALRQAAESLDREGMAHRADVPLGVMIETPAAAVVADLLAPAAAFFSIGSNDLAQYTLAADRSIAELAARYPHTHLAVLRLIDSSVRAAARAGIEAHVCGELAALPAAASVLVGLGAGGLSMQPDAIPAVKEQLRGVSLAEARELAQSALAE